MSYRRHRFKWVIQPFETDTSYRHHRFKHVIQPFETDTSYRRHRFTRVFSPLKRIRHIDVIASHVYSAL